VSGRWGEALVAGPRAGPRATASLLVRLGTGIVFVAFGIGKFTSHASEVASFRTYGLPGPDAFVYAIGGLELVGGLLLVVGFGTRIAALLLAGDMFAAIIVSGIGQGEVISLTLAVAQLAGMLWILWIGPGRLALAHRLLDTPPGAASPRGRALAEGGRQHEHG
jgi:putative oxidoreductase